MLYVYLKALHIVFVVTWFSGLFYLGRLLVYHREAVDKIEPERTILKDQLSIMIRRLLYAITWPSAIITLLVGTYLLILFYGRVGYLPNWLIVKLGLIVLLYVYHYFIHRQSVEQCRDVFRFSSTQLRLLNEVPTLFLFAIVFFAVLKSSLDAVYAMVGSLVLILALTYGVLAYKKRRSGE